MVVAMVSVVVVVVGPALGKMMDFVERGKEEKERMGDMTGGEKAEVYSSNATPMQPYNTTHHNAQKKQGDTQNQKDKKQCKTMQNEKCTHHLRRAYQEKKIPEIWTVSPTISFSTKTFLANHEYIFVNAFVWTIFSSFSILSSYPGRITIAHI